eukprot:CAMPEP_0117037052 /NCGR_PEP_ID=MMETSP0472-20121206/26199_1 /TAXON_ID=693140 ORGANISM="Tiarina fusus, Strain LIS" /NCGR_SAMPLE_ID=MMETSP0472 /ASSEMBLY_ACC=CAM_ASM_000603 /LENGTH=85 /DNA_ID=CAMNT_0004746969 /DNA_START=128 /DNA_END=385 /DNA_ORIENTATION=+
MTCEGVESELSPGLSCNLGVTRKAVTKPALSLRSVRYCVMLPTSSSRSNRLTWSRSFNQGGDSHLKGKHHCFDFRIALKSGEVTR